jgi:hypothetical protein
MFDAEKLEMGIFRDGKSMELREMILSHVQNPFKPI